MTPGSIARMRSSTAATPRWITTPMPAWCCGCSGIRTKRARVSAALHLARDLSHPFTLALALLWAAWVHQFRREWHTTRERAEEPVALTGEQGFVQWLATGTTLHGWALALQGQDATGIAQMRQGIAAYRATGAETLHAYSLALLAEALGSYFAHG